MYGDHILKRFISVFSSMFQVYLKVTRIWHNKQTVRFAYECCGDRRTWVFV